MLPAIVFTNIFAMFFLEVLSSTKQVVGKKQLDARLGHYVNGCITFLFTAYFAAIYGFAISKNG
jgi:hypothetical protein